MDLNRKRRQSIQTGLAVAHSIRVKMAERAATFASSSANVHRITIRRKLRTTFANYAKKQKKQKKQKRIVVSPEIIE